MKSSSTASTAAGYAPPIASGSAKEMTPPLASEFAKDMKVANATTPAKASKDSARYQQILNDWLFKPEAQRIPYQQVLCSLLNRKGQAINTRYIVEDIGPRVKDKGFAPDRARVGMVRQVRREEAKRRLIAHNDNMRKSLVGHYPPLQVTAGKIIELFECVASNHITVTIGCFAIKMEAYNGFVFEPPADDKNLKLTITEGHRYYILKEDTPDDDLEFLSEYLNAAQNQDQFHSEMHLQATVRQAAFRLLAVKPYVNLGEIIQKVCCESVVKLRADNVGDFATWVVPFHGSDHLENLELWHSSNVNPRELTVSSRFFAELAHSFGPSTPIAKVATAKLQYSGEEKHRQTRPIPDCSRTVQVKDLKAVVAQGWHLQVEDVLQKVRDAAVPIMTAVAGRMEALRLAWLLEDAAVRLVFTKSLGGVGFEHGVSGKFSLEKLQTLRDAWARHCVSLNDAFTPVLEALGVTPDAVTTRLGYAFSSEVLCPGNFDGGVFHKNPIEALVALGFTIGTKCVLTRRSTFDFTLESGKKESGNVIAGTETFVKGYLDTDDGVVTCEFTQMFGKRKGVCDAAVKIGDLKLAAHAAMATAVAVPGQKGKGKASRNPVLDLVVPEASGVVPEVVRGWPARQMGARESKGFDEMADFISFLGARVAECCPSLDEDDLTIVRNGSSYEVWTARDFKPGTLKLCPETTEVKERHFTHGRSALVHLKGGKGGKHCFLDSRLRSNPESEKHSFSMFYLVTRPVKADGCNMVLRGAKFKLDMGISFVDSATPKEEFTWDDAEAPCCPYMVNPNKIAKRTKLVCQADAALAAIEAKLDAKAKKDKEAKAAAAADAEKKPDPSAAAAPAAKKKKTTR